MVYLSGLQPTDGIYISTQSYNKYFEISGMVEPFTSIPMELSYPAYIKDVYVQDGGYVNQGQLLFTLDKQQMEQALVGNAATSRVPLELNLEHIAAIPSEIYASAAGVISQLNAQPGSAIFPGTPLCTISANDKTIMRITVNQEDYNRIKVGDNIKVSPLISPKKVYDGVITDRCATVRKENSAFGPKTVIDVFAQISNPDQYMAQGVQFNGQILKSNAEKADILPYEFVHQDEIGEYVNILKGGKPSKVYVKTGDEMELGVEILTAFSSDTLFLKAEKLKKDKILLINDI
ncbi:MAG: HlyD family efflux transporter periplasmic adaptor subunit [Oscillospiraceae bacterium]